MAPSTFASAAAGNNAISTRPDSNSSEWSRRVNGTTQTFRRPSLATSISTTTQQRDPNSLSSIASPGAYVPPHANSNRLASSDQRYAKGQLLDLFKTLQDSETLSDGMSNLYVDGWKPNITNGTTHGWGRKEESGKDANSGADVCWDPDGAVPPLCLADLTEDEKEFFSVSVNSPLKPPAQNQNKEGAQKDGLALRKSSISQAQGGPGPFGLSSPTSTRTGGRRREPSESYPFPPTNATTPANSRFFREDSNAATPPAALLRRATGVKESDSPGDVDDRDKSKGKPRDVSAENAATFGSFKRVNTGPFSANVASPPSPWSATPGGTAFSPMGSFGNFALGGPGQQPALGDKRPTFSGLRGESKFKGILSKDSTDDLGRTVEEKPSIGELNKSSEADPGRSTPSWAEGRTSRPLSNDTDPYHEDEVQGGGAAFREDAHAPGVYGTPIRQTSKEDQGFGAFGMTSDQSFRDIAPSRDAYGQQFTPQGRGNQAPGEPMSPTSTNPYQSPEHEKGEREDQETEGPGYLHGLGGFGSEQGPPGGLPGLGAFGALGRGQNQYEIPPSDRSQTSSTGPGRGFPGLGGLGGLSGLAGSPWSTQGNAGTPSRDKSGLGGGFGAFGSGDIQSPSLAGLGGSGTNLFGLGNSGSIGRSGKMGSLFPSAMQDQSREQGRRSLEEGSAEDSDRPQSGFGAFGRDAYSTVGSGNIGTNREGTESPFRQNRVPFEDASGVNIHDAATQFHASDPNNAAYNLGQVSTALQTPALPPSGQGPINQTRTSASSARATTSISSVTSNQPPASQQRTTVMPDRMRWIYRDPQGNTQGPWTGLEMHDWYKAGFFSPELLVKKIEDPDFEPLAHLIRKIGNSREPFLVPQIGIPHGDPPTPAASNWATGGATSAAQPPFANSFPTFGTTLTAEQQNALERRKQEEQYLMARQKEHLVQQQLLVKQMQMQGPGGIFPHQLQHHSSARSLHSQPSYGSITSPGGFQATSGQGPLPGASGPGFFENQFRQTPSGAHGPVGGNVNLMQQEIPGMMQQINSGRPGQPGFSGGDPFGNEPRQDSSHTVASVAIQNERARLAREQAQHDAAEQGLPDGGQMAAQAALERLQQFQDLRAQGILDQDDFSAQDFEEVAPAAAALGMISAHDAASASAQSESSQFTSQVASPDVDTVSPARALEHLTLTEQVQKAQAQAQAQAHASKQAAGPQSPWGKIDTTIPQPFPAVQQPGSPLMAPVAQRKQNLADALNQETHSGSETPSVETPSTSIAPWAKDTTEAPRGPSLKEIQEAEARKAAVKEEMVAAARRAALERDIAAAQAAAAPPAPGLPSSSTWASGASPSTPTSASSALVWGAKPAVGVKVAAPGVAAKKTLQQIQKEEEARKQRAATAAGVSTTVPGTTAPLSSGKRYADLASKTVAAPPSAGGAWTTVGSSGKAKTPGAPTPAVPVRSASGTAVPPVKPKSVPTPSRSVTMGGAISQQTALEQFKKWAVGELKGDLKKGINVDDLVANLVSLGSDVEIITEAVHSTSQTMDSRHFAEEFIRRRKLADKGIIDALMTPSPSASEAKSGGGWSEVAKKNPQPKEEPNNFKVVAAKKKGGKR